MVPCHPFNEIKPNSGDAAAELGESTQKDFVAGTSIHWQNRLDFTAATTIGRRSWSDCGVFVTEQTREPLPHVARFIEMIGHALGAPAHGERKTAKIGHEGEYRFVGDIVADKNRTAAPERFVAHQFQHAGCLVKA